MKPLNVYLKLMRAKNCVREAFIYILLFGIQDFETFELLSRTNVCFQLSNILIGFNTTR